MGPFIGLWHGARDVDGDERAGGVNETVEESSGVEVPSSDHAEVI